MTDLILQYSAEPWMAHAVCRSIGTEAFYPDKGDSWAEALKVCQTCPVRLLCLDLAMRNELGRPIAHRHGVVGGLKPHQRRKLEPQWLAEQAGDAA
jgi:WhiB family redox-sensing transcriptional regulator